MMETLVVIPSSVIYPRYSLSAPVAWLFSKHCDDVRGIYGYELKDDLIKQYNQFIVELNWFHELEEFGLVVNQIKKINKNSKILIGGLYAALKHKEIFDKFNIDYFIKGDNELPIQLFLDSYDPRTIPNFVGRDFENPIEYIFEEKDYETIEYNLDWFPTYQKYSDLYPFCTPMILTTKSGCDSSHDGCEYCLGSKKSCWKELYNRDPIIISNNTLIHLLKKVEKKFDRCWLQITSDCDLYDLTNHHFDLDVILEFDAKANVRNIKKIVPAFRKTLSRIAVYDEGFTGNSIRDDINEIISLGNENHKFNFFAYRHDIENLAIPKEHKDKLGPSEDFLPTRASFDFYMDFNKAKLHSKLIFIQRGRTNLYPIYKRICIKIVRYLFRQIYAFAKRVKRGI